MRHFHNQLHPTKQPLTVKIGKLELLEKQLLEQSALANLDAPIGKGIKQPHVYFPNLNSIRFIAAFLVMIHHIELFKYMTGVPTEGSKVIGMIGKLGVVLFFVLSGFLISYLLFKEKEVSHTISIRKFYMRRILRIWPLYFLIILAAFFVFPFINFFTLPGLTKDVVWEDLGLKLGLYVFFLPNLALYLFKMLPYAAQAWSIGAEEQFYLVWPALNKRFSNKWILMSGVIAFYLFVKFAAIYLLPQTPTVVLFNEFWYATPIDCMAIGGLFALIAFENSRFTSKIKIVLFNRIFQWLVLASTITLILNGVYIKYYLHFEFYAVLFGILICNFAVNGQRIFSMEFGWLNYLGKISYGLYMYHTIAIVFCIRILQKVGMLSDFALYPFAFLMSILISAASYEWYEKRFILKKHKYSKVISGDVAKQ